MMCEFFLVLKFFLVLRLNDLTATVVTIREGNGNPLQYSCLENLTGRGAWGAAVHGVTKSWTQLSDFTFTFHFHALEKEIATHSSVLAWRIAGMAEPGGLLSTTEPMKGHYTLSVSLNRNYQQTAHFLHDFKFRQCCILQTGSPGCAGSKEPACQCRG